MLNNATLKIRIDSMQSYLTGEELSVHGLASFKFRDRQQDQVGQIEFSAKGQMATQLQEAGVGAVGIGNGSIIIHPEKPNSRTILEIKRFEPITIAQPQPVAVPQPVPVAQPVAIPQPVPVAQQVYQPQPIPQPVPVPQPIPQPQPVPQPVPVAATGIAKLPF